ncbi:hypothetical protein F4778DRAFT_754184 [Xylariomycetidae sp. FL2044]|nr:hypothetical protein F4778DRAFT_754184 [Xylariomycetidae sp. FL2044]
MAQAQAQDPDTKVLVCHTRLGNTQPEILHPGGYSFLPSFLYFFLSFSLPASQRRQEYRNTGIQELERSKDTHSLIRNTHISSYIHTNSLSLLFPIKNPFPKCPSRPASPSNKPVIKSPLPFSRWSMVGGVGLAIVYMCVCVCGCVCGCVGVCPGVMTSLKKI